MSAGSDFPSMGATLFFGLTAAALITQGPPPPEFADPKVTMEGVAFDAPPVDVAYVRPVSWLWPVVLTDTALQRRSRVVMAATPPSGRLEIAEALPPARRIAAQSEMDEAAPPASARVTLPNPVQDVPPSVSTHDALTPASKAERADQLPTATEAQLPGPQLAMALMSTPITAQAPVRSAQSVAPNRSPDTQRPAPQPKDVPADQQADPALPSTPQIDTASPSIAEEPPAQVPTLPALKTVIPAPQPTLSLATGAETLPEGHLQPREVKVAGDRVFLRSAPTSASQPLGQYDTGDPAQLHERRGNWGRISIDGQTGWMFARFLDPNTLD